MGIIISIAEEIDRKWTFYLTQWTLFEIFKERNYTTYYFLIIQHIIF